MKMFAVFHAVIFRNALTYNNISISDMQGFAIPTTTLAKEEKMKMLIKERKKL